VAHSTLRRQRYRDWRCDLEPQADIVGDAPSAESAPAVSRHRVRGGRGDPHPKVDIMTSLDFLIADLAALEAAKAALPVHSHLAALFDLTLVRLRDEVEAGYRIPLQRAA
jgi:hypothetical protein